MSDNTLNSVKEYLYGKKRPAQVDNMHLMEMRNGKRAKSVIDKKRSNEDYKLVKTVHEELHNYYENVDWYERDSKFDFASYMERK